MYAGIDQKILQLLVAAKLIVAQGRDQNGFDLRIFNDFL